MQALAPRRSERELSNAPLSQQERSDLPWAADGINRRDIHEQTAPSAVNVQEIVIDAALSRGVHRYDADGHELALERPPTRVA